MDFLNHYPSKNQVYYLTPELPDFEDFYLKVRQLEGRVYEDEFVRNLPFVNRGHFQEKEWKMRQKSTAAFIKYFAGGQFENVLDLGCGNGWFTQHLASKHTANVLGMDINKKELEQAARINALGNCRYAYADLFHETLPEFQYNCIILNSCAQYFSNFKKLIDRLKVLLKEGGEIHILDSPIYTTAELPAAKARTVGYYESQGVPQMAAHYHHISWEDLSSYRFEVVYDPGGLWNKMKRKLNQGNSPFPWVKIY